MNNQKYIKKYFTYIETEKLSNDITPTQLRLKDTVIISNNSPIQPGKVGIIMWGSSKDNPDMVRVKLKNNKSYLIDKMFISKIAKADYDEEQ